MAVVNPSNDDSSGKDPLLKVWIILEKKGGRKM
jgi:hypothetical protein